MLLPFPLVLLFLLELEAALPFEADEPVRFAAPDLEAVMVTSGSK